MDEEDESAANSDDSEDDDGPNGVPEASATANGWTGSLRRQLASEAAFEADAELDDGDDLDAPSSSDELEIRGARDRAPPSPMPPVPRRLT